MPTFGGVCFLTFFYLSAPYICFGFLETLGGLFWVSFLTFQNFEIGSRIRMPTFGGVCFLTFFYWSAPYICFGFLETLGGLFGFNF